MTDTEIREFLAALPASPGVYLMKGQNGRIVYVGKAGNLRNRVRQYFAPGTSDTRHFVRNLASRLSGIEIVLTSTDKEASLLEYNLIQQHMPRYNIRLTDDRRFLHLRLDPREPWPRLELVRRPAKDGALYFGPYPAASGARETLRLVNRHFLLRTCRDTVFRNRTRPCLQHQIHRCPGPCTLPVDRQQYMAQVSFVRLFLEGRREDLMAGLKRRMTELSEQQAYEQAALVRDQLQAVEEALAPQAVTEISDADQDIIALCREGDQVVICVMDIVQGRLVGRRDFFFVEQEFPDGELLSSFLVQQYSGTSRFPDEILLDRPLEDAAALAELISDRAGRRVRIASPGRGRRARQVDMALRNAQEALRTRLREREGVERRLEAIRSALALPSLPVRIECVDIAHLAGTDTVGAISAFVNAAAAPRLARRYRLRTATRGDDFSAMREVLERRFIRAAGGEAGWEPPDLLVVDGGRGQLRIALAVLEELGIDGQPVVALAKEREGKGDKMQDRVFLPGRRNPIPLRETSALILLAAARDEAHRLANTYQADSRRRRTLTSALDAIPGVGPATRRSLLRQLGSVRRIREATVEELATIKGVSDRLARVIRNHFTDRPDEP